ncbi:archaeosine tRNA-ribosyltransferase [Enhygromyxa salina]|uniref:Archaeosine tRNA-ribosyltransferase n=1 Tax=Enhygromyxa salina TaxID=215803 RepID=A0A0C2D2V9_9BACT|nr:tRNA-guanine transglycosylase DpdA [Enhygromyxa salina]KIG17591.1 archaeosine tRNA-ribosyltransferase [Enhygromyxa salina]
MHYFLPDSQDLVDPSFDFEKEIRSPDRVRHRDDRYAHEVFGSRAFDGILVSKGIVDSNGGTGRYTGPQRRRFDRDGVKRFFRAQGHGWGKLRFMGDCGAFTYVKDEVPPYTVDEVIDFYVRGKFDLGVSVDHIILSYDPDWDAFGNASVPPEVLERQRITFELAREFIKKAKKAGGFTPLGVAQGWSPSSYAHAVKQLQKMGYKYIAIGGVVPLKTHKLIHVLDQINAIRNRGVKLHLLGVTRLEKIADFRSYGVASFDSTSPLRRAWLDNKVNYFTPDRSYTAVRVPQVDGNVRLQKRIRAGEVKQEHALKAEAKCLKYLAELDAGKRSAASVVKALTEYERIHDPGGDRSEPYREVLTDQPWKACKCEVCMRLGHHVIMFRGAERNRRRGFHNVAVFYQQLLQELARPKRRNPAREPEQQLLSV